MVYSIKKYNDGGSYDLEYGLKWFIKYFTDNRVFKKSDPDYSYDTTGNLNQLQKLIDNLSKKNVSNYSIIKRVIFYLHTEVPDVHEVKMWLEYLYKYDTNGKTHNLLLKAVNDYVAYATKNHRTYNTERLRSELLCIIQKSEVLV